MLNDQLDVVFGALAEPIRRAILLRLTTGDANVAELAAPFKVSQITSARDALDCETRWTPPYR